MLERQQAAIAATLLRGPAQLPADLFAGGDAAVMRGLRVHANTISHARLVALEETFPRTRDYLGEKEFNRLSRLFVDEGGAENRSLNDIGGMIACEPGPLDAREVCGTRIGEPVGKARADVVQRAPPHATFLDEPARQPVELLLAQIITRAWEGLFERD